VDTQLDIKHFRAKPCDQPDPAFGLGDVRASSLRQLHKAESKAAHRHERRRTKEFAERKLVKEAGRTFRKPSLGFALANRVAIQSNACRRKGRYAHD
jgi:hypothetical protein